MRKLIEVFARQLIYIGIKRSETRTIYHQESSEQDITPQLGRKTFSIGTTKKDKNTGGNSDHLSDQSSERRGNNITEDN